MAAKVQGKVYKIVTTPVIMYGLETVMLTGEEIEVEHAEVLFAIDKNKQIDKIRN